MEIGIAYGLLCRVLKAAYDRGPVPVSEFSSWLERYVRSEIGNFTELQDTVYAEIRAWNRESVATGKSYGKSFLFPRSVELFKRCRIYLIWVINDDRNCQIAWGRHESD